MTIEFTTEITLPKYDKKGGKEYALTECYIHILATASTGETAGCDDQYKAGSPATNFVDLASMTKEDRLAAIIDIVENDPAFSEKLTGLRDIAKTKLELELNPNPHAGTFDI